MNKNQLIEAGMALNCDQSAPQGPPVGHHARPAGSPALLLEGSAELQKVAGPHGYYIPPSGWLPPKSKPKPKPKPAPKLPSDYLHRRPTSGELNVEQGFHAPGGKTVQHKGFVAPLMAGLEGATGGAGGAVGNLLGGIGQGVAGLTDAVGITDHGWEAMKGFRVPYQQASERGWHQLMHNRTSNALGDYMAGIDDNRLTGAGSVVHQGASDLIPLVARIGGKVGPKPPAWHGIPRPSPVVGGKPAWLPVVAGEPASILGGMRPPGEQVDQVLARLSKEQLRQLNEAIASAAEQSAEAGMDPGAAVQQAKNDVLQKMMEGRHPLTEPAATAKAQAAPAQEKPMPPIDTALDKPVPAQAAPADPQEAGAAAARGMLEPTPASPSPQFQAGTVDAQAQVPPQAPPQAPQAAPGAPAAQPAPQQPPGAGPTPGAPAAPGAAPAASAAQLVWEGPVGDDAYQRALQSPMDRPQVNILTHAVNSGQIPQEQIPRAVQQIIAHNSVDKARQEAAKTGEPVEVVLGRIAQRRAQGEFDAEDLTRAVPLLEQQLAEADVAAAGAAGAAGATGATGDQAAIEQQKEKNRQDPSLLDRLSTMWEGMDDGEKIGLVVGIIGSVVALANTMMGGNGMTTIVAGALGLGGLGYAFGGGDMIKKWLGSDEQAAAQAPEASKSTPVPTGEDVSVGGGAEPLGQQAAVPEIPGGAEPLGQQTAAPEIPGGTEPSLEVGQRNALERILRDGQVSMEEITSNADILRGMETSRLVPLIQAAPPELQNQLSSLSKMGPEVLGGAVQWAVQQSGGKLTPEDIYKMLEAYKLASPQGQ